MEKFSCSKYNCEISKSADQNGFSKVQVYDKEWNLLEDLTLQCESCAKCIVDPTRCKIAATVGFEPNYYKKLTPSIL